MNLSRDFHRYYGPAAFMVALVLVGAIVLDIRAMRRSRHHAVPIATEFVTDIPLYRPEATR